MKRASLLFLPIFFLLMASVSSVGATNFLTNVSFEIPFNHTYFDERNWCEDYAGTGSISWTSSQAYSGTYSIRFQNIYQDSMFLCYAHNVSADGVNFLTTSYDYGAWIYKVRSDSVGAMWMFSSDTCVDEVAGECKDTVECGGLYLDDVTSQYNDCPTGQWCYISGTTRLTNDFAYFCVYASASGSNYIDFYLDEMFMGTDIPAPSPPPSLNATIVSYTISDSSPTVGQEISIKMKIRNTGPQSYNYWVGLSIGDNVTQTWCNRDCYTDGKGDYGRTGIIGQNEVVQVERKFRIRRDYFTEGSSYDVVMAVYDSPYLPWESAFDLEYVENGISVVSVEDKLFAYARNISIDKSTTSLKDNVRIKAYIENNGTLSWNFRVKTF